MKLGPDGSLFRITSSVTESCNKILILKVPDDDLPKFNDFPYKLSIIGADKNDCDPSSSEKSDEEVEDEETKELEAYLESIEKSKAVETDKITEVNCDRSKESSSNKFQEKQHSRDFHSRRLKHRRRIHSTTANGLRNYVSGGNNLYQNPNQSIAGNSEIEPWINPMQVYNFDSYSNYPTALDTTSNFSTTLDPTANFSAALNSTQICAVNSKTTGLLGDSPYSSLPHTINQSSLFIPGNNYWSNEYHSNNYPISVPSETVNSYQRPVLLPSDSKNYQRSFSYGQNSVKQNPRKNYQSNNRKYWNNKNSGWKRKWL